MARERKIKRAKERANSPPVSPRFFPALSPALSLALFFARAPLSERLEQARPNIFVRVVSCTEKRNVEKSSITVSVSDVFF